MILHVFPTSITKKSNGRSKTLATQQAVVEQTPPFTIAAQPHTGPDAGELRDKSRPPHSEPGSHPTPGCRPEPPGSVAEGGPHRPCCSCPQRSGLCVQCSVEQSKCGEIYAVFRHPEQQLKVLEARGLLLSCLLCFGSAFLLHSLCPSFVPCVSVYATPVQEPISGVRSLCCLLQQILSARCGTGSECAGLGRWLSLR